MYLTSTLAPDSARLRALALLLVTLVLAPVAAGQAAGERGGASGATTFAELLELQERIDHLLARAAPATVGLDAQGGRGTGIVISADGLVLTAAHVSGEPGSRCRVRLSDGREFQAEALGRNANRDASLVRILNARDLPHLQLPLPRDIEPGSWCIALGHPGGFDPERPAVARLGRVASVTGQFMQTDCALIGGDSGGPLFDSYGNLIGIHSRIQQGVEDNYHVPMAAYRIGWQRLLEGQSWESGGVVLGLTGVRDADDAGVRVLGVAEGGRAALAGVRSGDVLRRMNGELLYDRRNLMWLLADLVPEQRVTLVIDRRGKRQQISWPVEARGVSRSRTGKQDR